MGECDDDDDGLDPTNPCSQLFFITWYDENTLRSIILVFQHKHDNHPAYYDKHTSRYIIDLHRLLAYNYITGDRDREEE